MNKKNMMKLIDSENGKDFSQNIKLDGYNFCKNKSFISFKVSKIEGINIVNIRYFYSDNRKDMTSVLAYACNFFIGLNIKFIYYKEKEKAKYITKALKNLGFKIVFSDYSIKWEYNFECIRGEFPCNCKEIEAYI